MITEEQLKNALPAKFKSLSTEELSNKLNQVSNDPFFAERFRENLLSYTNVIITNRSTADGITKISLKVIRKHYKSVNEGIQINQCTIYKPFSPILNVLFVFLWDKQ